ncbi:MAG: type II toxin-antitoxin system VapC family toxin [Hyphomicrobiales bacterium]|nr:type II toxin-antitoxin system VapC family toxin [Hyphomicrobiales bacterium]
MTASLYMLDTNICSFLLRARPAGVLARFEAAAAGNGVIYLSIVTYYEMLRGGLGTRYEALIREFVARVFVLPWDEPAAEQAARIWRDLTHQGKRIGGNDAMIAGHALAAGCTLVTNNRREFARVAGLKIEDWS